MRPRVGPSRCGEKADLILSEAEIISFERLPRLARTRPGDDPTYAKCRELLGSAAMSGSIAIRELESGSGICVETDKGGIVGVRIKGAPDVSSIEIGFDVWKPAGE